MSSYRCNRYALYFFLTLMIGTGDRLSACAKFYLGPLSQHQHGDDLASIKSAQKDLTFWRGEAARLRPLIEFDYKARSDYAVVLMHLGQAADAIGLLRQIEEQHPGEAIVAANLGTAYELTGQNEKALFWIKEGIVRNAAAHDGTEWLHVRILNAKIKLAQDPDWLITHTVLGLDFGDEAVPATPKELTTAVGWERFPAALVEQLRERVQFVDKPDPIMADLFFDLGNVLFYRHSYWSTAAYEWSLAYGPTNEKLVRWRMNAHKMAAVSKPGTKSVHSPAPSVAFQNVWAYFGGLGAVAQLLLSLAIAAFALLVATAVGMPFIRRHRQSRATS